jgi:hypothetical protein
MFAAWMVILFSDISTAAPSPTRSRETLTIEGASRETIKLPNP